MSKVQVKVPIQEIAHSVTDVDSSSKAGDYDGSSHVVSKGKTTPKSKRIAKEKVKKGRKVAEHTNNNKPVDTKAIDDAMADYNMRPSDKPKRGRKPVREDIYISESLEKIDTMESRLVNEKLTLSAKERDELRNKASALRSRVNRKLEHRS